MELARRFIFILLIVPFPRNSVSDILSKSRMIKEIFALQIPPLLVLCIILVVYGFIQPYKSLTANIMEIVVQMNFVLLLALESTNFLKETYNTFPESQVPAGTNLNKTDICKDDLTGVSIFTAILLPFYYMPLFLLIILAIIKLILFIR